MTITINLIKLHVTPHSFFPYNFEPMEESLFYMFPSHNLHHFAFFVGGNALPHDLVGCCKVTSCCTLSIAPSPPSLQLPATIYKVSFNSFSRSVGFRI